MRVDVTLVMMIMMPHHHRKLGFFFSYSTRYDYRHTPSYILDMSSLSVPMRCDFPLSFVFICHRTLARYTINAMSASSMIIFRV